MTTDRYIRMCDTPLVQEKKPTTFSWPGNIYFGMPIFELVDAKPHLFSTSDIAIVDNNAIWLPRQEDWQEMIQPISTDELMLKFYQWYHKIWFVYQMANNTYSLSITELWCAFYFHEVHGMIWNDEKGWEK